MHKNLQQAAQEIQAYLEGGRATACIPPDFEIKADHNIHTIIMNAIIYLFNKDNRPNLNYCNLSLLCFNCLIITLCI